MATNFDQVIQSGLKAHKLAVAERIAIEARLAAGTIEGLAADLVTLGATVPGQIAARRAAKESTVSQAVALANRSGRSPRSGQSPRRSTECLGTK